MKIRMQRGGLDESLKTVVEIEPTQAAVKEYVEKHCGGLMPAGEIVVRAYRPDARIGWDTHIVIIKDFGPIAFTDGPLAAV